MADIDRHELHTLVDHIPESDVSAARKVLRALVDPVALAILAAPLDDEPETEEERASVAASLADASPDIPFFTAPARTGMKRVLFRPQAARDLERLPNRDRDQVEDAIERFVQTGSGDVKMLTGEGRQFRLRVRDWRVRFIYEKPDIIRILHIRNRREAYR